MCCVFANIALSCCQPFLLVSFHVGSGCQTPDAYRVALEMALEVFQYAVSIIIIDRDNLVPYYRRMLAMISLFLILVVVFQAQIKNLLSFNKLLILLIVALTSCFLTG